MDRQHARGDEDHHHLEQIVRPIGADQEVARRLLTELHPRDGLAEGMIDVLITTESRIGYRLTMTQPLHRTTFRAVALRTIRRSCGGS